MPHRSTKNQITLTFYAAFAAIFFIFAAFSINEANSIREKREKETLAQLQRTSDIAAWGIGAWFADRKKIIDEKRTACEDIYVSSIKDCHWLIDTKPQHFDYIYIGSSDGSIHINPNLRLPNTYDARKRPFYVSAIEAKDTTVTEPYGGAATGQGLISIAAPIIVKGKVVGVISGDIRSDPFISMLRTANRSGDVGLSVINKDGIRIITEDGVITENEIKRQKKNPSPARSFKPSPLTVYSPITIEGTQDWKLVVTGNPDLLSGPVNQAIVRQVAILFLLGGVSFILMSGLMYLGAIRPLRDSRARAVTENEAKTLFLANMSHEIRTPLNGVIGIVGALARTPLDARQREMVELITESGDALQRLLSDILDFSKISAGKFDLHPEPFDLRASIESATRILHSRAAEKGLPLNLRFSESVRGHFLGDAVRIRQIVTNLCANAIKFTESGHVRVEVTVLDPEHASEPCQITIAISDTGIGISHDMQARLFQRFEQADASVTRRFGGTGLGLSICKALTELMGGSITVSSAVGVGSCFQVVLPLHRTQTVTEPKPSEAQALSADRIGLNAVFMDERPLRVLLAEDHVTNQKLVGMILEPLKVDLTVVPSGREAVKAFNDAQAEARFDLILMDMQMPDMDGLAATQQIRACEASMDLGRTPIGMLSANALKDHMQLAMAAGCDLYLSKPVTPATLIDGVRRLMALRPVRSI